MPSNSTVSCINCTCYATQLAWFDYHVWYQTAMSCVGVVANLLILATLLAARVSHSCHVYVLALTLSDLSYCLCQLVAYRYMSFPYGVMGLWQCRTLFTLHKMCIGVSNWVMVLLAADRLRVVVAPLRTHAMGARVKCATAATFGACVALLAVNVPNFAYITQYLDLEVNGKWVAPLCYVLNTETAQALRATEQAVTILIPVVVNGALNIALCVCIWQMQRRRRRLSQVPASQQSKTSSANAERQLTRMLLATSIMHSVFSLPMACLEVVNLKESFVASRNYFLYLCINYSFGVFYSWHVFVNLPIYLIGNSSFRTQFVRLFLPCCYTPSESNTRTKVSSVYQLSDTNI